jgi:hypothetical protein
MTASASDKAHLQPHHTSKAQKKDLETRFKDPDDPLRMVIVRDMWLTGFDAPCLATMYIDKPMQGANLAQAIARVNRVFRDKPGGLVVDYIGIAPQLKEAMATYTAAKGKGRPAIDNAEALRLLKEKLHIARDLLHPVNWSEFETRALQLIPECLDHILGLEDGNSAGASAGGRLLVDGFLQHASDGIAVVADKSGNVGLAPALLVEVVNGRAVHKVQHPLRRPSGSSCPFRAGRAMFEWHLQHLSQQ